MRALLVRPGPTFSVQDVAFGWRDALRGQGVQVADFNFDDRLDFYCSASMEHKGEWRTVLSREQGIRLAAKGILAACYEFWPDVVVIVSGFFVPQETWQVIRSRGHKIVALCTESPYEDDHQYNLARLADLVILNDPTNLDEFRKVNPNTHYVPHAYDPARHHPGPGLPELKCDFAFVGTGFPSRVALFEAVPWEGLDVVLGGSWMALQEDSALRQYVAHRIDYCMDNSETADLYRSTKSSLNLYRREHSETAHSDGWAMGPREVELAACGTFFLRDSRPESDELFPMLPTFTEAAEIRPLLDWWLAHDEERERVAASAHEAIADRTFEANARWLLQHLDT